MPRWGTLAERMAERTGPPDENGCMIWTGYIEANGYPRLGKRWAHRVAYELAHGPIPDGFTIDHVRDRGCRSRACVNPDHLEPVTSRENTIRSPMANHVAARAGTCTRGHPLPPQAPGKKRNCLECQRLRRAGAL